MKNFLHFLILVTFQLIFQLSSPVTYAPDSEATEVQNQIKATYLYKFASYVDWPAPTASGSTAPFNIGVIGSDEVAAKLKSLVEVEGHVMNNRTVEVIMLKPNAPQSNVQILFISKQEKAM